MKTKEMEKFALKIKRLIKAPRERVYAAWTDPAQMKQWFGPEKVRTRDFIADVREGGDYRWDITSPDGEAMTVIGEYQELIANKKIVFTWSWDDDEDWEGHASVVTVELFDRKDGTELHLTHEQIPNEKSRDGHNKGWESVLDQLEQFVNAKSS